MIWLTVIQYIPTAVLAYLAFHLTFHPIENKKNRRKQIIIYTAIILVCIVGTCVVSVYQAKDTKKQQADNAKQIDDMRTNLVHNADIQKMELLSSLDKLQSNLRALSELDSNLREQLITNQFVNPELRKRIIESNSQFDKLGSDMSDITNRLNQYKSKLRDKVDLLNIQIEEKRNGNLVVWHTNKPYFDYSVNSLSVLLSKLAEKWGDTMITNYTEMPESLVSYDKIQMGELKLKAHSYWDFKIYYHFTDFDKRFFLSIKCDNTSLDVAPVGDRVDTVVHLSDGKDIVSQQPAVMYKASVDDALGYLVAAVANSDSTTNNK